MKGGKLPETVTDRQKKDIQTNEKAYKIHFHS